MATYVISDIHGHFSEFKEMLERISFGPDDELYILGDIIDRGPESAEILVWAVDEAPENIHFLMGNHEIMMQQALLGSSLLQRYRASIQWFDNKGWKTRTKLSNLTSKDWQKENLRRWLENLLPYAWIDAGGHAFLLVHAGLSVPALKAAQAGQTFKHENALNDRGIMHWLFPPDIPPVYEMENGIGEQGRDELVWARSEWLCKPADLAFHVVHGHSVISKRTFDAIAEKGGNPSVWEPGKILHYFENRHDIDCGCAAGKAPYALGCLRLDDMAEFYVMLK